MHPREMTAEGGWGWGVGMVMMCMIRRVDTTNHFVPMVTPPRLVLTRALSLIQSRLSHRNRDINLINISLLHLMLSKARCIFYQLLISIK